MTRLTVPAAATALLLAACQSAGEGERSTDAYAGIGPDETVEFTGTEPFWGGRTDGTRLTYRTPENIDGTTFAVERFAGNSGVSYSGTFDGEAFDMTVTEGECSDGMSDRSFPFTVTLRIGEETRYGCAYTEARPFTGPENP